MKIVVLAGGLSTERDVSLNSGIQICKALRKNGHSVVLLDVFLGYGEENGLTDLSGIFDDGIGCSVDEAVGEILTQDPDLDKVRAMRPASYDGLLGPNVIEICRMADIVYMGLHGAEGENGKLQAMFDILNIRYTGSGYIGSAAAMDKGITRNLLIACGVPVAKGFTATKDTVAAKEMEGLMPPGGEYPCIVKPCCGGSSVGVSIANDVIEYKKALETAFQYEEEIVVEEFISGREFSVGVLEGQVLPVIEIIPKAGFFDYETKYQPGMSEEICPARLTNEQAEKMQQYALKVYHELKLQNYGRIDFLMDEDGDMYCLEANTLPGMTPASLIPQEAAAAGIDYCELCERIVNGAIERYENTNKKKELIRNDEAKEKEFPMSGLTPSIMADVCDGDLYGRGPYGDYEISSIATDNRCVTRGGMFVAIKGERVDGNSFVPDAIERGALCILSEEKFDIKKFGDRPCMFIKVDSVMQAIKDIAAYYRNEYPVKVIGVTGSVGKTSTKEMLASVLSQRFITLKTKGNFNNELGLPLTLFRLRKFHQAAVVEMGISDFGEMTRLSVIAQPDICVITNIGQCHLENLGDRDGVLKAKTEIFSSMREDGEVYLYGDDDKLASVRKAGNAEPVFFGESEKNQVYAVNVKSSGFLGTDFEAVTPSDTFKVHVPIPGKHMVTNALAAIAVGLGMGMEKEEIVKGIAEFKPVDGPGSVIKTDRFTILNDCYNANPVSMKAGLDMLADVEGRKAAIIGDMFELGEDERKLHHEIGEYAAGKGVDILVFIGELAKEYADGARLVCNSGNTNSGGADVHDNNGPEENAVSIFWFASVKDMLDAVCVDNENSGITDMNKVCLKDGDSILVKASHGMHFENIVAILEKM